MNPGDLVGHYQMVTAIGAGGMGEVWKARDTRLHRDVAIKMLPKALATDADRLARFRREATLLAALNHPHIAGIHGLEEAQGTLFLVLELVEGGTLSDRIDRGALPIRDALTLALQIAESLEAAHARGIIHRDLKPANIKVTKDGMVKVLDFGLAKAFEASAGSGTTMTALQTEAGMIVGTPAYMSPEQARGEDVGPQTDIWSFGAVLYEMLTGRSPFRRPSVAETLAEVMAARPDDTLFRSDTPEAVRRLVRRCLEKDLRRRFHHIGDVRLEIEDALAGAAPAATPATRATGAGKRWPVAAGAIALIAIAGTAGWLAARRADADRARTLVRLSIPFVESPRGMPFGVNHLAISEDGVTVAYASVGRLWIRRLDQKDAVALAIPGSNPFFSPDGKWVGAFDEIGLIKVPVEGGAPTRIVTTTARPAGGSWRAGTIVFATTEGMFQVSENGGTPRPLKKADQEKREQLYAWPHLLPDGRSVLFTIVPSEPAEAMKVAALDLSTLETTAVVPRGSAARYLPTGHLVYAAGTALRAIAFDARRLQTSGEPVAIPDIEVATAIDNGAAAFAVSATGTLIFGAPSGSGSRLRTLRWADRRGNEEVLPVEPGNYGSPRLSPDGSRVAFDMTVRGNRDVYVLDLRRLTQTRVTTAPPEDLIPSWTPDGNRLYFGSNRTGQFDIYSQAADGASEARLAYSKPGFQVPMSLTPDGTRLLITEDFRDIGMLELLEPPRLQPLLHSEANEWLGRVSPDGSWIAYESNETGQQVEIILRPFPDIASRREKVSVNGGRYPLWGPKGSGELFYVNLEGEMMAASVRTTPTLTLGPVTSLFRWQKPISGISGMTYDISPLDGRFLITRPVVENTGGPTNVTVVLNWLDEVKRLTSAR